MKVEPTLFMIRRGATMNESYAAVIERVMVPPTRDDLLAALGAMPSDGLPYESDQELAEAGLEVWAVPVDCSYCGARNVGRSPLHHERCVWRQEEDDEG